HRKHTNAGLGSDSLNCLAPTHLQELSRRSSRPSRLGKVIDEKDIVIFDLADQVERFGLGRAFSFLANDGEVRAERLRVSRRHLQTADVGGNNDRLAGEHLPEVLNKYRQRIKVIDRNIEE